MRDTISVKHTIPPFLLSKHEAPAHTAHSGFRRPFVDGALHTIGSVVTSTFVQWEFASKRGLLQSIDARVNIICLAFLLIVGTLKNAMLPLLLLACLFFLLAALSRLDLRFFYRRVFALALLFGLLTALPAALNIITPGRIILPLITLPKAPSWRIITMPATLGITAEGLMIVARLFLRVTDCLSASFLLLYTTPLHKIIRSLKIFRVPDTVLIIFFLTYKYIFLFSTMLQDMYLAVRSRLPGPLSKREARGWAAGRSALLFRKTQMRCEDLFRAMTSRGLGRDITLSEGGPLRTIDVAWGLCLIAGGSFLLWM